jgi:hypothetical protein
MNLYVGLRTRFSEEVVAHVSIAEAMKGAFRRAGVLRRMQSGIPASNYASSGDPLKIHLGYEVAEGGHDAPPIKRMFQAIPLRDRARAAKEGAYSARELREGVPE